MNPIVSGVGDVEDLGDALEPGRLLGDTGRVGAGHERRHRAAEFCCRSEAGQRAGRDFAIAVLKHCQRAQETGVGRGRGGRGEVGT